LLDATIKGNQMLLITIINSVLVGLAVLIHFEALNFLSTMIPKIPLNRRLCVLIGIFGALIAHVIEIWLFAFGIYGLIYLEKFGSLVGPISDSLLDCVYFSFTCYTTLGFGDVRPVGLIRFLTGLEALTGVVLIAWTSSFMFIEMQKFWKAK
jgi:hypothetical protein